MHGKHMQPTGRTVLPANDVISRWCCGQGRAGAGAHAGGGACKVDAGINPAVASGELVADCLAGNSLCACRPASSSSNRRTT